MANDEHTGGNGRAATLHDVAKIAGVSIATASKAINGRGEVAVATLPKRSPSRRTSSRAA